MKSVDGPFRVLVIEDEYYIADEIVRVLRANAFAVVGPVASSAAAVAELERGQTDFAVVDINLNGSVSFAIPKILRDRGIPFLFLTGYDASILPDEHRDVVLLQKPHDVRRLLEEVVRHRDLRR